MQNVRDSVERMREANMSSINSLSEAHQKVINRTIANIENRVNALARQTALTATTAGLSSSSQEISEAVGIDIPCSTLKSTVHLMNDILAGAALHPKRVGWLSSAVYAAIAQNVITLSEEIGFVAGMQIYVVAPTHLAHRGAYIIGVNPSIGIEETERWKVLAYVAPNRDVEDIGSAVVDLFVKMAVALPSLVAGTSTSVVSQILMQQAVCVTGPLAAIPGKLAYISTSRKAPIMPIGPEVHVQEYFTDAQSLPDLLIEDGFDKFNSGIVQYPNPDAVASCPIARPTGNALFTLNGSCAQVNTARASGFQADFLSAIGAGPVALPASSSITMWKSISHQESVRHLLTGDFEYGAQFRVTSQTAEQSFGSVLFRFIYDSGNNGIVEVVKRFNWAVLDEGRLTLSMAGTTAGDTSFDTVRGLLLKTLTIDIMNDSSVDAQIEIGAQACPQVKLVCLSVPARATYLITSVSNTRVDGTISVELETHSEVKTDQAANEAKFLSLDPSLPACADYIGPLAQMMTLGRIPIEHADEPTLSASNWKGVLGKIKEGAKKFAVRTARGIAQGQDPVTAGLSAIMPRT